MNWSLTEVADVPPADDTVTSTPPVPAGESTVIDDAESAVTVAGVAPKSTTAEPRSVPVMVTVVPPEVGPVDGETEVTVGGVT
jgi:hypothetical protein